MTKQKIAKEELIGDLVLVSNFESLEKGIVNNTKSVWFKNWKIKSLIQIK